MNFFSRLGSWIDARRKITALELANVVKAIEALVSRVEALESKVNGLPVDSNQVLANDIKQLKTKVEQLGLRIGFKAGSGIS